MTKLAPVRIGGLMMGVWFLARSVGNFIGGRVSGVLRVDAAAEPVRRRRAVRRSCAGVILLLLAPPIKRLMGEVN